MTGLSRSHLRYRRAPAAAWPAYANVPQAVGHLPLGYIRLVFDKLDEQDTRECLPRLP